MLCCTPSPSCVFVSDLTTPVCVHSHPSPFHVLIATLIFLSACPNYFRLASLIFSLMFAHISSVTIFPILFIRIINLNIPISVLAQPHSVCIRTGLMTFLNTSNLSRIAIPLSHTISVISHHFPHPTHVNLHNILHILFCMFMRCVVKKSS